MANYLLVYYGGGMGATPEAKEKSMAAWMKWFKDMGSAVVDMGAPTKPEKLVSKSGVKANGANPVTGYTVVKADSLDAVVEMVKKSPQLNEGGQIAIYTVMAM